MNVGSGLNGQPVLRLPCANSSCTNHGTQSCSNCRLVKYCSKECQTRHWKIHRIDCKGPVMSSNWLPAWAKERRTPDFIESESSGPSYTSFGLSLAYLWGNLPAIDCLNLPHNEGSSAKMKDFKLCFGASGDLRNLIRTVNCLPEDYAGQCDILFNDINPLVVGHNIVVLWALLNPILGTDEAVELALHLMYSSMLTSSMSDFLSRNLSVLHDLNRGRHSSIATAGEGRLIIMLRPGDLDVTMEMLHSKYGQSAAANSYSFMMCNPSRRDYSDRYLDSLEPAHRLAFTHYRSSGILAPFSLDTSTFCEPNRLLYSSTGIWLLRDNANPLQCWDVSLTFDYGEKCGVNRNDTYGCLFFYLKNELHTFARRIRECRISITMTNLDANNLPTIISSSLMLPFSPRCFDRIEMSNLADYVSPSMVVHRWAPLLNCNNKFAALLVYFMNWQGRYPVVPEIKLFGGREEIQRHTSIMGIDIREMLPISQRKLTEPRMVRLFQGLSTFADDHEQFQSFLQDQRVEKIAASCGLKLRGINRVHPKRAGVPLNSTRLNIPSKLSKSEYYNTFWIGRSESATRFVEFELASA